MKKKCQLISAVCLHFSKRSIFLFKLMFHWENFIINRLLRGIFNFWNFKPWATPPKFLMKISWIWIFTIISYLWWNYPSDNKIYKHLNLFLKNVNKQLKSADIFFQLSSPKKFHKIKSSWHWKLSTKAKYFGQKIKNKEKIFFLWKLSISRQIWQKFWRFTCIVFAPLDRQQNFELVSGVKTLSN